VPEDWRTRPLRADEHEWAYALHRVALGACIEATWGAWNERLQRRIFRDAVAREPREVIEVGGEPVGVLCVEERGDEIYLGLIELLPEWQGRGIGTAILRSLASRARETARALTLDVLPVNARAIALYEREGLTVVAREEKRLGMRLDR
jgi:ribosomal protein S18 acetylase RimI-like enzyme